MKDKEVGFIIGKFAPLHNGHINFIHEAATQVDILYVILCYDEKFINRQTPEFKDHLGLKSRLLWLKHTFNDHNHIKVFYIDETNILEYPEGWADITKLILDVLPERPTKVFSSEPSYDEGFKKYFPDVEHIISNRDSVNISATQIREDINKYWEFLPSIVRKDFVKTVCIVGTESCGKTTLVKYLAKAYNTSWVEEYGRKFVEKDLLGDESLLNESDYRIIAYNHILSIEEAKTTANRILFIDTNLAVTQYYLQMYEGKCDPVIDAMASLEKYDMTIYLDDDVPWIDDGMRTLSARTEEAKNILLNLLEDDIIHINGSYSDRLKSAKRIINENYFK